MDSFSSKKTYNAGTVPADILVHDGATLRATYTMFDPVQVGVSDQRADADGTLEIGTGCAFLDPLLVTAIDDISAYCGKTTKVFQPQRMDALCAIDCHVRPKSLAIDAGDPKSAYRAESTPNGRHVNLGAYGNTSEATTSKQGTSIYVR